MRKRRKLDKQQRKVFDAFFKELQEGSRRYSDPVFMIKDYDFYEGVDDREVDCLMAIDILEHQLDVDEALKDIKKYARRVALIIVQPDFRGKDYWQNVISKYFMVSESYEADGRISFVANQKTILPGAKIVAAGTDESRWSNIAAAVAKYPLMVEGAPPHDRVAKIVCYGPSLQKSWEWLKDEEGDVFSVSGAHDFLIERGIVPKYHIECDPRPHKADNLKAGHPDVEYLLSSVVHPRVFAKAGIVRLWHSTDGQVAVRIREELKSKAPIICGGGCVGLRALSVAFHMGYRKLHVYGMDCSSSDDGQDKWAGPHAQKENHKDHRLLRVEYDGRFYTTTGILLSYLTDFADMSAHMMEVDPNLEFHMYGDGLLQARCAGPAKPIQIVATQEAA
jgi:hypothetical protein